MSSNWKLSQFDLFTLNMVIKGAWAYKTAPDATKMKDALAELARIYPILCGRYSEQSKAITWEQAEQLPFQVLSMPELSLEQACCQVWSRVPKFDLKAFKSGKIPPFSAVLLQVKDGAILYVQCAHAAMDAHTFYAIIGQWAQIYRSTEQIEQMVVDQNLLPSGTALSKEETLAQVQQRNWVKVGGKKIIKMIVNTVRNNAIRNTCVQEVSQEQISALKEETGAGTHAILSAFAMKRIAEGLKNQKRFKLLFVIDLRGRFSGIDSKFFGNLSQPILASDGVQTVEFDASLPLSELIRQIDAAVKAALAGNQAEENIRLSLCSQNYSLPYIYFDASDMNCPNPATIYVNNQLKFRACELDWGHGLPAFAFPNDLPDMVKFWQMTAGGPVQIIYAGFAAKISEQKI